MTDKDPVVLSGSLPQSVFDSLTEQGLASTGPVAGLYGFPPQTVFLPQALPVLNSARNGHQYSQFTSI
jgi:hypothetical protein